MGVPRSVTYATVFTRGNRQTRYHPTAVFYFLEKIISFPVPGVGGAQFNDKRLLGTAQFPSKLVSRKIEHSFFLHCANPSY
jgi:hypothetical protein